MKREESGIKLEEHRYLRVNERRKKEQRRLRSSWQRCLRNISEDWREHRQGPVSQKEKGSGSEQGGGRKCQAETRDMNTRAWAALGTQISPVGLKERICLRRC